MAIFVSAGEGSSYTPIEEGTYMALCYGLVDTGDEYSEKFDKCQNRFSILWELVGAGTITVDGKEYNRSISKSYTKSLNAKSTLRKDLRAWRGREFTDEELKKFNMSNILGAPCQIQVINSQSGEKTYSNIAAIMSLPKGMPKPQPTQEMIHWDFQENTIDDDMYKKIPAWLKTKIETSETYQYITKNDVGHLTDKRLEEIRETEAYKAYRAKNGEFPVIEDEDELPFD